MVEAALGRPLEPAEVRHLERAPWADADRRGRRDALIRTLAGTFSGSTNARAGQVQAEFRHYAAVCWPNDRRRGGPYPPSERRALLFELFRLDPEPPQSLRQLNTILAAEVCNR